MPPFHVFHDATLMEMVQFELVSDSVLFSINGVGEVKLEKLASMFFGADPSDCAVLKVVSIRTQLSLTVSV